MGIPLFSVLSPHSQSSKTGSFDKPTCSYHNGKEDLMLFGLTNLGASEWRKKYFYKPLLYSVYTYSNENL